jgi:DNA mismatch repair protein MutL
VKAAGIAPGTRVEVRQLFFNLPARRKFLRSEETESAHIQHYLMLAALAFPEVAFTFQKDARLVWQLPALKGGGDTVTRLPGLRERLRALYGDEQKLLSVNFSTQLAKDNEELTDNEPAGMIPPASSQEFRLWGFIGAPGVSRATRQDQHLFVNRRPVENRGLNFALLEGYHTALMKGRYPVCCLFLEIEPAAVDVNIHPSKREVKFHREAEVRRLVARAVHETLLKFHGPDLKAGKAPPQVEHSSMKQPETAPSAHQRTLPNFAPEARPASAEPPARAAQQPALRMGFGTGKPGSSSEQAATEPVMVGPSPVPSPLGTVSLPSPPPHPGSAPPPTPFAAPVPLLKVPLRLVGVIGRLYVVLESDRGLVLLDQHAAHERILFEQMLNRMEQNQQAPSQRLLLPETVELSARDANFLREQLPVLARLGVSLSEFGERTFLLDSLPPFAKAPNPRRFVLELVDELKAAGQEVNSLRLGEHTVAKTVCRHAVKANDPLAGPELENLVEDLRHCAMPYTCPHGRPTLIEMNFRELEKKFGRTQ